MSLGDAGGKTQLACICPTKGLGPLSPGSLRPPPDPRADRAWTRGGEEGRGYLRGVGCAPVRVPLLCLGGHVDQDGTVLFPGPSVQHPARARPGVGTGGVGGARGPVPASPHSRHFRGEDGAWSRAGSGPGAEEVALDWAPAPDQGDGEHREAGPPAVCLPTCPGSACLPLRVAGPGKARGWAWSADPPRLACRGIRPPVNRDRAAAPPRGPWASGADRLAMLTLRPSCQRLDPSAGRTDTTVAAAGSAERGREREEVCGREGCWWLGRCEVGRATGAGAAAI